MNVNKEQKVDSWLTYILAWQVIVEESKRSRSLGVVHPLRSRVLQRILVEPLDVISRLARLGLQMLVAQQRSLLVRMSAERVLHLDLVARVGKRGTDTFESGGVPIGAKVGGSTSREDRGVGVGADDSNGGHLRGGDREEGCVVFEEDIGVLMY